MKTIFSRRLQASLLVLTLLLAPQLVHATTWFVMVGPGGGRTFVPATVNIAPGDTVEWDWAGNFHSATSGTGTPDGNFDSGVQNVPATFTHVFPTLGSFPYYCTIHGVMMSGTVNVVAATATPAPTQTPTPGPTASPTPATVSISGAITYCSNPVPGPVANVTVSLTGTSSTSVQSDSSGNYQFSALTSGGSYTVTPTKAALTPGSAGINTVDVVATQRHFLSISSIPPGCRLTAADVNGDSNVTTVDVIAIQRFFLGLSTGTANVGKYNFNPANRSYAGITSDQTGQNYDTLIFGDVASPFADRATGPAPDESEEGASVRTVSSVISLPTITVDSSRTHLIAPVVASLVDPKDNLVGFQGDFSFDSRVLQFEDEPVQKAGITSGDWSVAGNVLPGTSPIRTLRISAYSRDFRSLAGEGTLFELRMKRVRTGEGSQLIWAAEPNQFLFIDADLRTREPASAVAGRVGQKLDSR